MSTLHHKPRIRVGIDWGVEDGDAGASIMEVVEAEAKKQAKAIDAQLWTEWRKNRKPADAQPGDWYENHNRWRRRVITEVFGDRVCHYIEFCRDCSKFQDPDDPMAWERCDISSQSPMKIQSLAQWARAK